MVSKKMLLLTPVVISLAIAGCSNKRKVKKEDLSYTLSDMSTYETPDWVFDETQLGQKDKEYKYFVGDYDNVNKVLCQKGARANATEKLVAEISQEINSIYSNKVGDDNGKIDAKTEANIKHQIQSKLGGVENVASYWEQKNYKKSLGADADKKVYSCYQAVKIKKSTMKEIADTITNATIKANSNYNGNQGNNQ